MKFTWAIITYKYADYSNSNTWDGVLSEDRRERLIFFSILNIERSVHLNVRFLRISSNFKLVFLNILLAILLIFFIDFIGNFFLVEIR